MVPYLNKKSKNVIILTMILSVTFSKPAKSCQELLGKDYTKVRIFRETSLNDRNQSYMCEFYTEKQVFHKKMNEAEVEEFIKAHAGKTFRNVYQRTDSQEISYLANRHGEIKVLTKNVKQSNPFNTRSASRTKNYLITEGIPVPFLVKLGVMTKEGKVVAQKHDKFRQINRYLEFVKDILADVRRLREAENNPITAESPLRIADFGCGKSYLTFAVYYYLTVIEKLNACITGLDLKVDVIAECQKLAEEFNYTNLHFYIGDIADFNHRTTPDIIITLHACDTATDYALKYAVSHKAKAILCVPCCQHEINLALKPFEPSSPFASLSKYGIIRERFAALATDALRAEYLEQQDYSVQVLEFIDMAHTPKNLLIRAVRKDETDSRITESLDEVRGKSKKRSGALLDELKTGQTLFK